jgi:SOUL heme-binding protein
MCFGGKPQMNLKATIAIVFATLSLAGCSLTKHFIEHASYSQIIKDEDFEVREYLDLTLVTAPIAKSSDEGSSFRTLFNYISGNNSTGQEFSMTAPVLMDAQQSKEMSFVLPTGLRVADAPEPLDENVVVEQKRNLVVAVIRFSGLLSESNIKNKTDELNAWMKEQQYQRNGTAFIAGYDPPSSIPWFRRNEVLIPIKWTAKDDPQQVQ